jgi:nucleotide-binding universal stress UspA family protein
MFVIRNLMAAIDFSEPSILALRHAEMIARRFDAELCAVHVIPLSVPALYAYPVQSVEWQTSQMRDAENRMRALVSQERGGAPPLHFIAQCGHADEEILKLVHETNCDLLVIGSHGRRPFQRWFLGSVASRMLRRTPIPMLTVTDAGRPEGLSFKRILATTDFSDAARFGLEVAGSLARAFGSELTVVHVLADSAQQAAAESFPTNVAGVTVHKQVLTGTPYRTIVHYAEENAFDLIVLGLQGKGFVERSLLGTTAERVIRSTRLPVLSMPHPIH